MKALKITFLIIFMFVCLIQTVRHVYVRFNYDRPSVLNNYDQDQTDRYIKNSESLELLRVKFDSANQAIKIIEKGKTRDEIDSLRRENNKLYDAEYDYRNAIQNWESKEEELHEVIVFWLAGLFLLVLGSLLYYKNLKWLGIALIIPGLTEMIWWSSPQMTSSGATLEFLKLLSTKLILSFISLITLASIWMLDKDLKSQK
jgi:uncharacterized protein YhaN